MSRIAALPWWRLRCVFERDGFAFVKRSRKGTSHWVGTRPGVLRPVIIPEYGEVPVFIVQTTCAPPG